MRGLRRAASQYTIWFHRQNQQFFASAELRPYVYGPTSLRVPLGTSFARGAGANTKLNPFDRARDPVQVSAAGGSKVKLSNHLNSRGKLHPAPQAHVPTGTVSGSGVQSLPVVVANAFTRLRLAQRVRVLRRLLLPVGPMALAVLAGGVFGKYVAQARWPRMSISLEDAARVTSSQVHELARYVQQSNPHALQQVLVVLARDTTTMAALGASVAALALQHVANRKAARAGALPHGIS